MFITSVKKIFGKKRKVTSLNPEVIKKSIGILIGAQAGEWNESKKRGRQRVIDQFEQTLYEIEHYE